MQAKNHMTKLIKFSSRLPSWRTLAKKGSGIRLHYSNKNSEMPQDELYVGNEETDFKIKNLLS